MAKRPRRRKPPPRAPVIEAELVEEDTALAVPDAGPIAPIDVGLPIGDLYVTFLRDKSDLTARNYRIDLESFAAFLGLDNVPHALAALMECTGPQANAMVLKFRQHLQGKNGARSYSNATINRRLAALRSVCKLARLTGGISWILEVGGVKAKAFKDTSGCGVDGYQALIAAQEREITEMTNSKRIGLRYRDLALLRLMYHAGLRRMESLTVDYPHHVQLGRRKGARLNVIGKARDGEREWVPISKGCAEAIRVWIEHRGDDPGPLFVSLRGTRLLPGSVNERLARLAKLAGVDVTPHGLRHTAITEILERTQGDLRTAQRFARHRSADVTVTYDDNRRDLARRGVDVLDED